MGGRRVGLLSSGFVCRLVSRQVGLLVSGFVGRLVSRRVGLFVSGFVGRLVSKIGWGRFEKALFNYRHKK